MHLQSRQERLRKARTPGGTARRIENFFQAPAKRQKCEAKVELVIDEAEPGACCHFELKSCRTCQLELQKAPWSKMSAPTPRCTFLNGPERPSCEMCGLLHLGSDGDVWRARRREFWHLKSPLETIDLD